MKLISTFFSIFTCLILNAQSNSLFSKVYWSDANYRPSSVMFTDSFKLLTAGLFDNHGHITSMDSIGIVEWSKSFQSLSSSNPICELYEIIPTHDSAFIVVGNLKRATATYQDAICIKFNHQGDTLWTKVINSSTPVNMSAYSVVQTIDSNILISGRSISNSRSFLAKLDENGNILWSNEYTTLDGCGAVAIAENQDSTIYVVGKYLSASPNSGGFISKFNFLGQLLWSKKFDDIEFHDIKISNGQLYLASMNPSFGNPVYIKTDLNANVIWSYRSNSNFQPSSNKISLKKMANGNFMSTYGDQYPEGEFHVFDQNGFLLNSSWIYMAAVDVIETPNKNLYIVGYGPIYGIKSLHPYVHTGILKMDSLFTIYNCGTQSSTNFISYNVISQNMVATQTNSMIELASSLVIDNINISNDDGCVDFYGGLTAISLAEELKVYPNSSTGIFYFDHPNKMDLKILIYNSNGQQLLVKESESSSTKIDMSGFSQGIYFYRVISSDNQIVEGKLILIE